MATEFEELAPKDRTRLEHAIEELDTLSAEVGADGSFEIIEELYLLITKILERYPELELDDGESIE